MSSRMVLTTHTHKPMMGTYLSPFLDMNNENLRLASQAFKSVFKEVNPPSYMDEEEAKFMDAIHSILATFRYSFDNKESSPDNPVATVYDFPAVLEDMKKLMELYQTMFHMVSCIREWEKDNTPSSR